MSLLTLRQLAISVDARAVVHDASLSVAAGETVALVGASGSGKSLTARACLGLLPGGARVTGGELCWRGQRVNEWGEKQWRQVRGKDIAIVLQDPQSALHPLLSIETQLVEAIRAHERINGRAARDRAMQALADVGLQEASRHLASLPHQLSGGMRQRVAIAMALINRPALIIADEATTALDVTLQAQIVQLLQHHATAHGSSLLWISHDLALVAALAQRIAVMDAGRVVECAPTPAILEHPRHAATRALLDAVMPEAVR